MSTLLLRLAGPLQSWGTQSRFIVRDTQMEPSKSGVVGLICAALGRHRDEPVDDLATLRMGVRVDREGSVKVDYHIAGGSSKPGDRYGVLQADGLGRRTVESFRYYLADADFLVGLEGDDEVLLRGVDAALGRPRWPLYLGRKAFVPGVPVRLPDSLHLGVDLGSCLRQYPWPPLGVRVPPPHLRPQHLRLVLESDNAVGEEIRHDQPVGAAFAHRRFTIRHVISTFLPLGAEVPLREE